MLDGAGPATDVSGLRSQVATIRDLRTRSEQSLAELATSAGIGKSTLHAIETEDANPGIETLWALARTLGVPFGHLLEPSRPLIRVDPAGTSPRVVNEASTLQAHLLASTGPTASPVELATGDLATFPGDTRHGHEALEDHTRAVLLIEYP